MKDEEVTIADSSLDHLPAPLNRATLLTPPGAAAIAVVRVSGAGVEDFLRRQFSRSCAAGRLVHGDLHDDGVVIDDPVVALAPNRSWADINLHGGAWVVHATLDLLRRAGFEVIEQAGEAPDLVTVDAESALEAEVLEYLPRATTELGLRLLLSQPKNWCDVIKSSKRDWPTARRTIELALTDRALHHLLHPPRVAIIGAANVGKSTLANRLFAQERSITADLPGTTRDWVGEPANLDGLPILLVDTPGIRQTDDPIEREALTRSGGQVRAADLIVLVLDASRPLEPEQSDLLAAYQNCLVVVNKSDRPSEWTAPVRDAVHTIATTGYNVDELIARIRRRFDCEAVDFHRARAWTQRQREVLHRSLSSDDPVVLRELFAVR